MKMQLLKGLALTLFVLLLSTSAAKANLWQLRADIPFDFTVGHTTLPAGPYTVSETVPGVLVIRNENLGDAALMPVADTVGIMRLQDGARLFFAHSANGYSLDRVRTGGASDQLPAAQRPGVTPVIILASLR